MLDGGNGNGNTNQNQNQNQNQNTNEVTNAAQTYDARIAELERKIDELRAQPMTAARGTREVAPVAAPVLPLAARIESALRADVLTLRELAKATGESTNKVSWALRQMKRFLGDVGTKYEPRYTWKIGAKATPEERQALILRLVQEQPLSTAELVEATGIPVSLVSGALVSIQRSGARVINVGSASRHRTFVIPEKARDAALAPKAAK